MRGLSGEEGEEASAADIHEAQHEADYRIGAATDAMINSLSRIHMWVVYRSCSTPVCGVFRMRTWWKSRKRRGPHWKRS